jgi:putative membrane protein
MMRRTIVATTALLAAAALMTGCGDDNDDLTRAQGTDMSVPQASLTDSELAQILLTANMGEVAEAQAAQPKLSDAQAKQFADRMVSEHSAAITREQALYPQIGITPVASATSQMLMSEAAAGVQQLQATPAGMGFDLTYLCMQIRAHAEVVALIDANIGSAGNAQLANEAEGVRTTAADHLLVAQDTAMAIGRGSSTGAAGNAGGGKDLAQICAPYGGLGAAGGTDGGT